MEMTQLHLGHTKAQAYDHAIKNAGETVGIPTREPVLTTIRTSFRWYEAARDDRYGARQ
jgi:hypothetical protein